MQRCCDIAWLACAIDSEGCIAVSRQVKQSSAAKSHGIQVQIYNSDAAYVEKCRRILNDLGVTYCESRRLTSKVGKKMITEIRVQDLYAIQRLLGYVIPEMASKKNYAMAVLTLVNSRVYSREERGDGMKASWSDEEHALARLIRKHYMPATRANGESLTYSFDEEVARLIPSEASGSTDSTEEPLETTWETSATNNPTQECPATLTLVGAEDIVRSSGEPESGDKEPREDIAVRS